MKLTSFVVIAALLVAGCANVHVHFPAAPAEKKADTATGKPAP